MALKYKDLENLVLELKRNGIRHEVTDNQLRFHIGKNFGISEYTMNNIKDALLEFRFIEVIGIGIYKLIDTEKTVKQKELEAQKEANEVINKVG